SLLPDRPFSYRVVKACCRTLAAAKRHHGAGEAYEWVGLFVRSGSKRAKLTLRGLPGGSRRPFGSMTDLAIGQERASALRQVDGALVLEADACRPLTLLRIYWPLER